MEVRLPLVKDLHQHVAGLRADHRRLPRGLVAVQPLIGDLHRGARIVGLLRKLYEAVRGGDLEALALVRQRGGGAGDDVTGALGVGPHQRAELVASEAVRVAAAGHGRREVAAEADE